MRRSLAIPLVVILGSSFLVGTHAYLALRLVIEPDLPEPWRGLAFAGIALGAASLVLQPIVERTVRPPLSRVVSWPASLWMGIGFLLLNLLLASDALSEDRLIKTQPNPLVSKLIEILNHAEDPA